MLCGTFGPYRRHLQLCRRCRSACSEGVQNFAAMNLLMLPRHTLFICDTSINPDPTAEQIAEMTMLAAEEVRRFGLTPRVALLSHSSFGSADTPSACKMRDALGMHPGAWRPSSRSRARCTPMRRSPRRIAGPGHARISA